MEKYYVLCEKDADGKKLKENKKRRELYDRIKRFSDINKATKFALSKLNESPILMKEGVNYEDKNRIKNQAIKCVIAVYFEDKYRSYCYDGSSDPVPTHEIERCSLEQLESKLENVANEEPDKIYFGIELKLFSIPGGSK